MRDCITIRALSLPNPRPMFVEIVLFPSKSLPLNHLAPPEISFPPIISAHGLVDDPSIPVQARIRQILGGRGHDDTCRQVYWQYHLRLAKGPARERKLRGRESALTKTPRGAAWLGKNAA